MKRVLVVEDLPQVAEHLKGMLERAPNIEIAGVQPTGEAALQQVSGEKPDIVMIDALLQDKKLPPFELAKKIHAVSPATRVVIVTVPQREVTPRPDQGIDAVFVLPGGANELQEALDVRKEEPRGRGEVIALFSPKGGAGKTTVALNLAVHLRRNGSTVALMDAVLQFGSARTLVPAPPEARSIVDAPAGAGLASGIGDVLWEGPGGVSFLFAPPRPEESELVAAAELGNAALVLARTFDYVIVDTPARLSEEVLAVLDAADLVLLLLTYDPAAIANARLALDTFGALYQGRKRIVVAMNGADASGALGRGSVEHTLQLPIAVELPSDPKTVAEAAAKQQPFVLGSPTAPVSVAIGKLAAALLATQRAT